MSSFTRLALCALTLFAATATAHAQTFAAWNRRISDVRIVHPPGSPPGTWRVDYELVVYTQDTVPLPSDVSTRVTVALNGVPIDVAEIEMINGSTAALCNFMTCNGGVCGAWGPHVFGPQCRLIPFHGAMYCVCEAKRSWFTPQNNSALRTTDTITVSVEPLGSALAEIDTSDDSTVAPVAGEMPGQSFCSGDGSLADHTTACPCGNNGAPGNGCAHSFSGEGANLMAFGTTSPDTVVLTTTNLPASSFGLYLQHDAAGDHIFHDGVLCAGGSLIRLRGRPASGGTTQFPDVSFAQDSTIQLSTRGGVAPGSGATRYYSTWFRNASTSFCPPATANVTNGWRIDW